MKKFITMIVMGLVMAGCAGTSLSTKSKQTLKNAKGYKVGDVNVTLAGHGFYDFSEEEKQYPNAKELSILFKEDIEKYFKKYGKFCESTQECLTFDMDISYGRLFNIASVSTSAPLIDRTITIRKGNTLLYTDTKNRLQPNKGGMVGNALNELAMFTKALEDKANLEDEREYIRIFSMVTVKDILKLAQ